MLYIPVVAHAESVPTEGYSWNILGTIAGAAAFTLLFVQYIKAPLDKVWKVPTRMLAYGIAFLVMLGARAFTIGLNLEGIFITAVNAWLAGATAIGTYESTFKAKDEEANK